MSRKAPYSSWGNQSSNRHRVHFPRSEKEAAKMLAQESGPFLGYGMGRSYGDSCLNADGSLLHSVRHDRIVGFDERSGIVECEPGVTIDQLIELFVLRGWFPPVVPGTRFITIAGAVANDIHGKNHERSGSFGCFVESLRLLRSDGQIYNCSAQDNSELFYATIGGLGLTGYITRVSLRMRPVTSGYLKSRSLQFDGFVDMERVLKEEAPKHEYSVMWLDCSRFDIRNLRGLAFLGDHAESEELGAGDPSPPALRQQLTIPSWWPGWTLNQHSIRLFNGLKYHSQLSREKQGIVDLNKFFFPLDGIRAWNRLYGRQGLFQFQCVIPDEHYEFVYTVLQQICQAEGSSFLVVLKRFGNIESGGMLSFPMAGTTIAADFSNRGESTRRQLKELERLVIESRGRIYPAKDGLLTANHFQTMFERFAEFENYVDPQFSSEFWRRCGAPSGKKVNELVQQVQAR